MIDRIKEMIDEEVLLATESIQRQNESLSKTNKELREDIKLKDVLIKDLQKGDLFSKYAKNVNNSNIGQFLTFIFSEVDNPCGNSEVTKAPEWFYNVVKYWSNKDLVLKIYDMVGIQYDRWIHTAKMPYEWNQQQCDLFLLHIGNHFVCNGAIYDNNLGYWLGKYKNRTIEQNIMTSYSEIPWQLVLKNPLWLQEENFNNMLRVFNRSHGLYFIPIYKYQSLSEKQLEILAEKLIDIKYTSDRHLGNILVKIPSDSYVWEKFYRSGMSIYGIQLPDKYRKLEIASKPNSLTKLTEMYNSKLFSKEEIDEVYTSILCD